MIRVWNSPSTFTIWKAIAVGTVLDTWAMASSWFGMKATSGHRFLGVVYRGVRQISPSSISHTNRTIPRMTVGEGKAPADVWIKLPGNFQELITFTYAYIPEREIENFTSSMVAKRWWAPVGRLEPTADEKLWTRDQTRLAFIATVPIAIAFHVEQHKEAISNIQLNCVGTIPFSASLRCPFDLGFLAKFMLQGDFNH